MIYSCFYCGLRTTYYKQVSISSAYLHSTIVFQEKFLLHSNIKMLSKITIFSFKRPCFAVCMCVCMLFLVTDPQSAKELKDLGNSEFKKGNYTAASQYYSQAIDVVKQKLPPLDNVMAMLKHNEEKHELAVLFSNRAECYIKMDKVEEALNDAKESVSWDGHWYRVCLKAKVVK